MRMTSSFLMLMALAGCEQRAPAPTNDDGGATPANEAAAAAAPVEPDAAEKPVALAAGRVSWSACPPGMPEGCQLAVLHGNPAKPDADIFLRVPGGATIAPHWHSSSERIMLASGRLEVQYKGAAPATLETGDYAFGPARLPHRAVCRSAEPCTLFIAFDLPVDRHSYDGEL